MAETEENPVDWTSLYGQAMSKDMTVHTNIISPGIVITEDKLRNCLHDHKHTLRSRREFIGPAGILATLLGTRATSEIIAEPWLLDKAAWEATYFILTWVFVFWTAWLVYVAISSHKSGGVDTLIDVIANKPKADLDDPPADPLHEPPGEA